MSDPVDPADLDDALASFNAVLKPFGEHMTDVQGRAALAAALVTDRTKIKARHSAERDRLRNERDEYRGNFHVMQIVVIVGVTLVSLVWALWRLRAFG